MLSACGHSGDSSRGPAVTSAPRMQSCPVRPRCMQLLRWGATERPADLTAGTLASQGQEATGSSTILESVDTASRNERAAIVPPPDARGAARVPATAAANDVGGASRRKQVTMSKNGILDALHNEERSLKSQLVAIQRAIEAIEGNVPPAAGRGRKKAAKAVGRPKRTMSEEQRRAVAERMRKYWASRREADAAEEEKKE